MRKSLRFVHFTEAVAKKCGIATALWSLVLIVPLIGPEGA